jgi:hypothetical protein
LFPGVQIEAGKQLTPEEAKNMTAQIAMISALGIVTIEFNQTTYDFDVSLINSTSVSLYVDQSYEKTQESTFNVSKLNLTWIALNKTEDTLILKVSFDCPLCISDMIEQDELVVDLSKVQNLFVSTSTNKLLSNPILSKSIRRQMS